MLLTLASVGHWFGVRVTVMDCGIEEVIEIVVLEWVHLEQH